jgi:hypothetical protein
VVLVRGKGHGLCFAISLSFIHLGVFGGVSSTGREEGSIALKKKLVLNSGSLFSDDGFGSLLLLMYEA